MTPNDEARKRGLGRGLSSLLGEDDAAPVSVSPQAISRLPIDLLLPNPWQPRQVFNPEAMESLVASVRERGVIQPILVRASQDQPGHYQIIAGERRWRAAQAAKLHEIPVVVRQLSDSEALELALIENIQRSDLSPLEEAKAYRRLMDEFHHTQEILAQSLGKSRSHIANSLRLLSLPESVQKLIEQGKLSSGHARALITAPDPVLLAEQVIALDLSVRETEKLAQQAKGKSPRDASLPSADEGAEQPQTGFPLGHPQGRALGQASSFGKPAHPTPSPPNPNQGHIDADRQALERDLSNLMGLKVAIDHRGQGGKISVYYENLDQLDAIVIRLNHAPGKN
ncbi:MAG: ParB/RepB/Spo0J family partition protein [Candidatus Symbiobacter sp.]|nr:ParB/RepB/Spo0J family partition protein [Candidatus Symbiobacter sp.]